MSDKKDKTAEAPKLDEKRWLFSFEVPRTISEEVQEKSKNEDGEEVTVTKTVKKEQTATFAIKRPNRRIYDDGELFYGVQLSEGIKAGLLTKSLLSKRYENDGGFLSEPEKEEYARLYVALFDKEQILQETQLNLKKLSEEKKQEKIARIVGEMGELRNALQQFEQEQSAIFDQTAENRARNKTVMWWVLFLAHELNEDDRYIPVFGEGSYEEKLNRYDEIEEDTDNVYLQEAIKKFAYFISFWYNGQVATIEDFKNVEQMLNQNEEEVEEVEEAEDTPKAEEAEKPKKQARKSAKKSEDSQEQKEPEESEEKPSEDS